MANEDLVLRGHPRPTVERIDDIRRRFDRWTEEPGSFTEFHHSSSKTRAVADLLVEVKALTAERQALLAEAVKLVCDPDDPPVAILVSDRILDQIESLTHEVEYSDQELYERVRGKLADFCQAYADEIHPLHELVKAAGACICPPEKPEATP